MNYTNFVLAVLCYLLVVTSTIAQSRNDKLQEIQGIVKSEGEIFIAIDRINPGDSKVCLEENSFINHVQFNGDSAFVNYVNYTELFCEAYVLRSQYTYQFNLQAIDPTTLRLVEKKYAIGQGKLREGNPGWYEVQAFTKDKNPVIVKNDLDTKQAEKVNTVSMLVKDKEKAKQVLNLLKSALQDLP
jgi:hypothetical protein